MADNGKRTNMKNDVKENKPTLRPVKPEVIKSRMEFKRQALGEVGNKVQHPQAVQKVGIKKTMSQQIVQSKTARNVVLKKTNTVTVEYVISGVPKVASKPSTADEKEEDTNVMDLIQSRNNLDARQKERTCRIARERVDNSDDPMLVCQYAQKIYLYLLELENQQPIQKNFLESHRSTPKFRSVLINWLVDVHISFKLLPETFHLSVAILDRYLQTNKNIDRSILQLVGVAALMIATKYEEIYMPSLLDYLYICENAFKKGDLLDMEIRILKGINFNLGRSGPLNFLRRFYKIIDLKSPDNYNLGKYLLDLSLCDYDICHVKPSMLAAATCCLSISLLNNLSHPMKVWDKTLEELSTYKYQDFAPVVVDLAKALIKVETSKYQAIRRKYASPSYKSISMNSKLKGPLVQKLSGMCPVKWH